MTEDRGENISTPGARDCGTFYLDVMGAFGREDLDLRWTDQARPSDADVDVLIDHAWKKELQRAEKDGCNIFNGQLARLINHSLDGQKLRLDLGPVSYREFVGTNLRHPFLQYSYGPEILANPLGISAAVATNDGFILLGRRSRNVVFHQGMLHPIGGIVECAADQNRPPDPFAAISRELIEETAIPGQSVVDNVLLGMVRDKQTDQSELIFDIKVDLSTKSILDVAPQAVDAAEHTELVPVRNDPGILVTFLQQHFEELTPIAQAALLLHGLAHWGSGWFTTARGYIRSIL